MKRFAEGLFWALFSILIVSFIEASRTFFAVVCTLLFIVLYILPLLKKRLFKEGLEPTVLFHLK